VCPGLLNPDSVVYSFGVGRDLSFDLDVIERHGATVHAFDPTPASVAWVAEHALPSQLIFHPVGIADFDGEQRFHGPRRSGSAHFTPVTRYRRGPAQTIAAPVKRLSTILHELGHEQVDLLKLDIEGGEYSVLADILNARVRISQLLVEFHHAYSTIPLSRTLDTIAAQQRAGFRICAISDRTYEYTFVHESALAGSTLAGQGRRQRGLDATSGVR